MNTPSQNPKAEGWAESSAVALRPQTEGGVARPIPTTAEMLMIVIDRGITSENVAAFKELVQLQREETKLIAQQKFAEAFLEMQSVMPTIVGCRPIPDKQGNVKFRYANFDDIDAIVRPICLKYGFTYAFRETAISEGRITVTMTLEHKAGHFREIPYSVRAGSGPHGANESQTDVSGHTYAQRGAIESGLSLRIVGARDDAGSLGAPITAEQVEELKRRVMETETDPKAFLKFAQAATFPEIMSSRYDELDAQLRKKEARGK